MSRSGQVFTKTIQARQNDSIKLSSTSSNSGENVDVAMMDEKTLESLQNKYETLLQEHQKLIKETTRIKNYAILPEAWIPYLKLTFLWAVTASILFALAEHHLQNGYEMAFGAFLALGSTLVFLAIPATHLVGRWVYSDYKLWQPLEGGIRFVVLQAVSWSFYGMTFIIVFFSILYAEEYSHTGIISSAGIIGILSQVFMISSLMTFQYSKPGSLVTISNISEARSTSTQLELHKGERASIASLIDPEPSGEGRNEQNFYQENNIVREFLQLNLALVIIGMILGFVSENTEQRHKRFTLSLLSIICTISGICLTHGIGGLLRHSRNGWRFSQVFIGGKRLISLQITAWSLFGAVLIINGLFLFGPLLIGIKLFSGAMYIGGFLAVASQIILSIALNHFKGSGTSFEKEEKSKGETPQTCRRLEKFGLFEGLGAHISLLLLCNTQYVYVFSHLFLLEIPHVIPSRYLPVVDKYTFGLIPDVNAAIPPITPLDSFYTWLPFFGAIVSWVVTYSTLKNFELRGWVTSILFSVEAVLLIGGCLKLFEDSPHHPMLMIFATYNFVYMSTTHTKMPEYNGCREWKDFRKSEFLFHCVEKYFSFELLVTPELEKISKDLGKENSPPEHRQVILGFHPHGIYPTTHVWLSSCMKWRDMFPSFHVNPMTASVTHVVPIMRDIIQWLGVCDVSKKSVYNLLSMGRSIQIVVGGQTEMFESRSWDKEITLIRGKRKGIFKIAIQHGIGILPMYSFGEPQTMDNIYMPNVQAYTKRLFGLPIPYFPYGRWGIQMPRRVPISVAMDYPVYPVKQNPNPSSEEILEFQQRYFQAVENLFNRFKDKVGHGNHSIKWMD